MREDKKPAIRLVRNKDGTLRAVDEDTTSKLNEVWGKQPSNLNIKEPSLRDDFKTAIKSIKSKPKAKHQHVGRQSNPRPANNAASQNTHTFAITFPSIKIPEVIKPANISKKYYAIAAGVVVVLGLVWLVWPSSGSITDNTQQDSGQVAGQISYKVTPEYPVMSPRGDGVENLGGYALISPAGEPKVYAYTDKIGEVPIKVSQQELPDSIGQDAMKLREMASQFNATEQIEVDDRAAYVGNSVNGPQSVIFARENILVLIASDSKVPNQEWVKYLGNLRF